MGGRDARSQPGEVGIGQARAREGNLGAGEVAQLGQRSGLHGAAGPDDAHPVAEVFHLGKNMAGEQNRGALRRRRLQLPTEDGIHQRVEARGRLIEDEQVDRGCQGRDQRDLLPIALRVGAALLGGVELKGVDEVRAAVAVGH